jgi:EAL domain-containing protein (putative c-di-GMP-specific phosphodiesterase class I)
VPSTLPLDGPDVLVQALQRGEFRLEYQPVLEVGTGWVLGLDALVRWVHPKQGRLLPGAFLGVAKELGFMGLLGEWVLQRSCQDLAQWQKSFGMMVSGLRLNLTPDQFADPLLSHALAEALEANNLRPHQLCLEIGEETLQGETQLVVDRIKAVRSLGVRLCLDGFGADGLRLELIARFPLDELKLAPQVIKDIEVDPRRAIVIRGLFATCGQLGIEVTAKNVETEAQADALVKLRCQRQQGHWHREAMDEERVLSYLAKQELVSA